MRLISRIGTTLSAVGLAAGALTFAGGGTAQAVGGHCGYPPGQCTINFDQSSYFPKETVSFRTDKAFAKGESVRGHVHCRKHHHFGIGPYTANRHHRVNGSFVLPKGTPRGTCSVRLVGQSSGFDAVGSFFVKHHHH